MDDKINRLSTALAYYDILFTLIELLKSHAVLSAAEYDRDPSFNNAHPAYIAEENAIKCLEKMMGVPIAEIMEWENEDAEAELAGSKGGKP